VVPAGSREIDFVRHWAGRTGIPVRRFIGWLGIAASKYHDWTARYASANEHNATVPRDGWHEPWEEVCLHSAIGYVTPADQLAGRDRAIFAERDRKLEAAR
jgi:hypothetical protein